MIAAIVTMAIVSVSKAVFPKRGVSGCCKNNGSVTAGSVKIGRDHNAKNV